MTDKPVDLDRHRGMNAQKATDLRRLLADVEANERALRAREDELEAHLIAAPSTNWAEAITKVRYVLRLYLATLTPEDTRGHVLVDTVIADLSRLAGETSTGDA